MSAPVTVFSTPALMFGVVLVVQFGNAPVGTPPGVHPPGRVCGVHGVSSGPPGPSWVLRSWARATQLSSHSTTQQYGSLRQM